MSRRERDCPGEKRVSARGPRTLPCGSATHVQSVGSPTRASRSTSGTVAADQMESRCLAPTDHVYVILEPEWGSNARSSSLPLRRMTLQSASRVDRAIVARARQLCMSEHVASSPGRGPGAFRQRTTLQPWLDRPALRVVAESLTAHECECHSVRRWRRGAVGFSRVHGPQRSMPVRDHPH